MPQLLHPSFLGLVAPTGGGPARPARDASVVVIVRVQPADASDPYVAGSDPTRVSRLSGPISRDRPSTGRSTTNASSG